VNLSAVLAIARAEARLTRRLARYWVFMVLAFVVALAAFLYYCTLHGLFSSYSATVSSIGPRWLVSAVGQYFTLIMMTGLVFLGFDLLGRDRRERVVEVMDSRPFTNLELVFGRFLGVLLPAWLPVVVLALVIQGLGWALPRLGAPIGEPAQPWSVVGLVFLSTLPAFAFTLAVVYLVTVLVRHRLAAAILSMAVVGGTFAIVLRLPIAWGPLLDIVGAYQVDFPSDIVPRIADPVGWAQRFGVLVAALGLLVVAAALHPRLDGGSKGRALAVGGGVTLLGAAILAGCVGSRLADIRMLDAWAAAHAARAGTVAPDVRSMTGRVDVDPGRRLALDLELEVAAPAGEPLESLLFSLNPGLEVSTVEGAGGALRFEQADGLLEVWPGRQVTDAAPVTVRIVAGGRPDRRGGDVNSAKVPEKLTTLQAQLFPVPAGVRAVGVPQAVRGAAGRRAVASGRRRRRGERRSAASPARSVHVRARGHRARRVDAGGSGTAPRDGRSGDLPLRTAGAGRRRGAGRRTVRVVRDGGRRRPLRAARGSETQPQAAGVRGGAGRDRGVDS